MILSNSFSKQTTIYDRVIDLHYYDDCKDLNNLVEFETT